MAISKRARPIQNINDPDWFLNPNASGDFNTISADQSGYGILSSAEKNSTYIAYFESIGSQTPEIINQTGFFIKYLIDEQGNITEPVPGSIALLNLNNILPQGSTVIVESQDATQALANLIGEQIVTDVGTMQPLMITETGSNPTSYVPTMSFSQFGSILLTGGGQPPDYTFLARNDGNGLIPSPAINTPFYVGSNSGNSNFGSIISNPLNNWKPAGDGQWGVYQFDTNTGDYDTNVSFEFKTEWSLYPPGPFVNPNPVINIQLAIQLSTDGGTTWSNLPITNITTTNGVTPAPYFGTISNGYFNANIDDTAIVNVKSNYFGIKSIPQQFNMDDRIRFYMYVTSIYPNQIYGAPYLYGAQHQWTSIKSTTNYSGELQTLTPYWDGATWPTDGTPQYLTASLGLSNFINNDMVQLTPTASLSMSFSPIILPANIQPGDNIRFEYDPSKVSKIYDISALDDGRSILKINPAIPTGSKLDHFVIYRIINDGNYAILNVNKGALGQMSGFLKPKYISKTLQDNLPNIIDTLKKNGSIPS